MNKNKKVTGNGSKTPTASRNLVSKAVAASIKQNDADHELTKIITEQMWEELDPIYVALVDGVVQLLHKVLELVKQDCVLNAPEESRAIIAKLTDAFKYDCHLISNELKSIHDKHVNRSGSIKNENELFEMIDIHQEYLKTKDVFITTITPCYIDIVQLIEELVVSKTAIESEATANE